MKKKICVITGARAEYGLLKPLLEKIDKDVESELQLVVTGMHLSPEFGLTYKDIENDGYTIYEKVEILLGSDTPIGISKSMGLGMIGFAEVYGRLKPDLILVLGDRYEIFAAVSAAAVTRIPVAHLHGGEITEGAFDEGFRHSITKMSYLHFTSTEEYRKRVIQLGEHPDRVFNVGAIGVDNINNMKLLSKKELEESIGFEFGQKTALVTFHPVTLENQTSKEQFENILKAIDEFEELKIIFTKSNADTDGRIINSMMDNYVDQNKDKAGAFVSMGQLRYLSAMRYVDIVVGNSSSGIIEAPSFKIPTINIGDRQKGRIQAKSVINCKPLKNDIIGSINKALSKDFRESLIHIKNPYGNDDVSYNILKTIKKYLFNNSFNIKKGFYDIS
ncbi:MAG: UDP-N-acetylglucosamine 2-epimerase [Maledivibacter sp.]|jgi:GDP/UDP-N,N'-diacetylbacillosamine 2-epimerase (hydrolysing)|nr:UDP-N-acetylglucosamine 2-epimerase [Maledivibacter sp.]